MPAPRIDNPQRRRALKLFSASACLAMTPPATHAQPKPPALLQRRIPKAKGTDALPVIGIGTYQTFDVAAQAPERAELKQVLLEFAAAGGTVRPLIAVRRRPPHAHWRRRKVPREESTRRRRRR